jgi:peroxiredoxin
MASLKRTIVFVLLICPFLSTAQERSRFLIRGTIENAEGKKVYIAPSADAIAIDSATVKQGFFLLEGFVKEPDFYAILIEGKPGYTLFILSNAILEYKGHSDSLRKAKISGSKELSDERKLKERLRPHYAIQSSSFDSTFAAYDRRDSIAGLQFENLNVSITKRINDSVARFIQQHPASYISLAELNRIYKHIDNTKARKLFYSLSKKMQNHSVGKQLKYEIEEISALTALNKKAVEFSQKDTAGKLVKLSDYKGNYLLLDFWASWCLPCRAENPKIKEAYYRYHQKGFEVLAVSLDNNKQAWINAIIKDEIPWRNVSDLNGFKNAAARKYGITELPTNFLLNKEGKIIARNLSGQDLNNKLKEIFGDAN